MKFGLQQYKNVFITYMYINIIYGFIKTLSIILMKKKCISLKASNTISIYGGFDGDRK